AILDQAGLEIFLDRLLAVEAGGVTIARDPAPQQALRDFEIALSFPHPATGDGVHRALGRAQGCRARNHHRHAPIRAAALGSTRADPWENRHSPGASECR